MTKVSVTLQPDLRQVEFEECVVQIEPDTGTLWVQRMKDKQFVVSYGSEEWAAVAVQQED